MIQNICQELTAKTVLLIEENGQILFRAGSMEEERLPTLAALVAAMGSAGKSVGELAHSDAPKRISCEFAEGTLHAVSVADSYWLATLHESVLNPGLLRMRVKKHAEVLEKFFLPDSMTPKTRAKMLPVSQATTEPFANITDEEIDSLFLNATGGPSP